MIGIHLGIIVASWIAYWGYRRRFLTGSGAAIAWVLGGCVWAGGRWSLAVPLLFFFVVSSKVTRWAEERRGQMPTSAARAMGARNGRQVGANGAVAAVCAIAALLLGENRWLYGALCALAAMTGDTWSSEIGRALVPRPLDLRTFRRVDAGVSGAVSLVGSLAGLVGTVLTTSLGILLLPGAGRPARYCFLVINLWAFAAMWVDSILGAFVQMRFRCQRCGVLIDNRIHCGEPTHRIAGISRVDNNLVNFLTTIFAALVAIHL